MIRYEDEIRALKDRIAELEVALPFGGRVQRNFGSHSWTCNGQDYCGCPDREPSVADAGDLVCSDLSNGMHKPVIDLDVPCRLVESKTPGHFHLYIDVAMTRQQNEDLLNAMARVGVVESGYAFASKLRGYSAVRHPDRLSKPAVEAF